MSITFISALLALVAYLLALLWLGAQSLGGQTNSADSYFLADRRLRAGVLFFTLIATNFSAFFFLALPARDIESGLRTTQ